MQKQVFRKEGEPFEQLLLTRLVNGSTMKID